MGHLTIVAVIAVFFTLFVEIEASKAQTPYSPETDPFAYNYQRLRIGGLVCASLLFLGGLVVLLYTRCSGKNKKVEDDNSEI
ncbi:FXYD domain-containing ion transport regulator 11 [Eleginops maclovinus]|uniref:FXYD domain-containing ion transport regulator 11 n=1 Tax=Eleginops maclovinus TaxID=56733 RepID=UPI00307FDFF3